MLDPDRPIYAPILMPSDREAFAESGEWPAAMVSASFGVNPRSRELCRLARDRADLLLVDPKTACYQYEGYMSMEDLRAVSYSPGGSTLGVLWQPRDFASPGARADLSEQVLEVQRAMDAGVLLAPYFMVPTTDHPWLEISAEMLCETLAGGADRPIGGVICIEIDALLGPGRLDAVAHAYAAARPAMWMLIVVNHDERAASPVEMRAVLGLIDRLGASAPVLHAYAGRGGLVAAALGGAGYAAGALELDTHPKRFFREGLINLHANSYYLPGCMVQLPVRAAAAVAACLGEAMGNDPTEPPISRLVSRRRAIRAFAAKRTEMEALVAAGDRPRWLLERLEEALSRCEQARTLLDPTGEDLAHGAYHYLEVMREVLGGSAATMIGDAGF